MYERSAIILEKYLDELQGNNNKNNLKSNFQNYKEFVEEMIQYNALVTEEEKVIKKFDEVAGEIQTIQAMQEKLHKTNENLEEQRNLLFSDLDQNPNILDSKLTKIELNLDKNNEQLKELREKYVKSLVIFIERQKERNKYTRMRREKEAEHIKNIENITKSFQEIDYKIVQTLKKFINEEDEDIKEEIINIMIKNGKNEKVKFNEQVIRRAVEVRIDIAKRESKCYIEIYEKTKKFLSEIDSENLKLSKYERILKNTSVILTFLNAEKEYIVGFLDNERMNIFSGAQVHKKMMEEACKNFETDIIQIDNLYELILKETTNKATKKIYKELYNKTYLRDIEENEKSFEKEMTNVKINVGTLINSNYWRMEGIKNIYEVFQDEVSSKFDKDLSDLKMIEETIEVNNIRNNEDEYYKENEEYEDEEDEEYYDDEDEKYDDDDDEKYDDDDDDEYDDDDDEEYEDDEDEEYDDDDDDEYEDDEDEEYEDDEDEEYEDDEDEEYEDDEDEEYDDDEDEEYDDDEDEEYEDDEDEEYEDDEDEKYDDYEDDNEKYNNNYSSRNQKRKKENNRYNPVKKKGKTKSIKTKKIEKKNSTTKISRAEKKQDKKFLEKIFGNKNRSKKLMEK